MEAYLKLREQGHGRGRAAGVFGSEKAMSVNHPVVLDRAFRVTVERAKAIFVGQGDVQLHGIAWVQSLTGQKDRPLRNLNQYCLEHRVNGMCLTRYPIHLFREKAPGSAPPHNPGSTARWKVVIDSW